jgi:2-polyprenyl-3-methyl-5-hydroxy-6-metoxy-1,4-benzoquinol methylase
MIDHGLHPTPSSAEGETWLAEEREFLRRIAKEYPEIESPTEHAVRRAAVNVARGLLPSGGRLLELGCADGYMARRMSEHAGMHVVVDAVTFAATRFPDSVEFRQSLFEEFTPDERFDLVVMCLVLEHVLDPVALMARARRWIDPERGRILAIVPNMRALSRQLARAMGIVGELDELTPNDLAHGHRRCYDRIALDREIATAGGDILQRGGLLLKPFANFQMDQMIEAGIIGRDQLDGLEVLGAEYPDLCTALYAVFR